jgi:EamA domain-containing membrane protein RarD
MSTNRGTKILTTVLTLQRSENLRIRFIREWSKCSKAEGPKLNTAILKLCALASIHKMNSKVLKSDNLKLFNSSYVQIMLLRFRAPVSTLALVVFRFNHRESSREAALP